MNTAQQLSVDEASRLAVTAAVADLEDWARGVADRGQLDLVDLVGVLNVLRADSLPRHSTPPPSDSRVRCAAGNPGRRRLVGHRGRATSR
jgi:hypothetical protein